MSYIVEVAEDGTLTLPAEAINHAAPHTRYVVENQSEKLMLNPQPGPEAERQTKIKDWMREREALAQELAAVWPEGLSAADAVAEQRR